MFQKGRKAKRSKKKKILSLIIVVAVTGTSGAVVYRKVRRPMAAATETDNVQQTEVKKGSISNTITGTGNLELDDAEAVTIPSGLTIEDVLVESGDYVSAGTVSGVHVSEDGKTLEFQIVFPSTAEDPSQDQNGNEKNPGQDSESTVTDGNDGQNTTTDSQDNGNEQSTAQNNSAQNNGNSQNSTAGSSQNTQSGQSTGGANGSSTGSSATGGTSASGENSSAKEDTSEDSTESASQYSTDVTAFTISPDENRLLSVSVDELDINSVELGQKAVVTFDAIEDQEFEGEVTKIGNTASVNGGVAKYTITITIPKDEKMKQGMNASATITIEEREDVLTLPMNALQEKGDRTFVYTEKDADGNLSGETEVTTGLSDGSTVEITDGLEEGTAVYYLRSENSSSDSGNTDMKMPDMGGNGMDSGAAPQMGGNGGGGDMGGGPGGGGGQGGPGK